MQTRKTTLDVNEDLLRRAGGILGTRGIKDTINAALYQVIELDARRQTLAYLQTLDLDVDTLRADVWRD